MQADDSFDPTVLDAYLPSTKSDLQATVFVHSLAPVGTKTCNDRLVAELDTLVQRGALSDLDLLVWGNSISTASPLTEVGTGQRIVDAVSEFYDLAAGGDCSIAPFFKVSQVTTEYSDDSFSRIVPPSRAVALYDQSELAAVFPCLIDGTAYTPEDLVAYLDSEQTETAERLLVDESAD